MVASKRGRLFALLSSSGGCGSSTLAVNLATALAKKHEHALLLDLKLGVGDLPSLLDLKPVHSLADLCKNLQRLDRSMFEQVLVQHSSGVQLLAAPTTQADCSQVTAKGVWHALTIAATMFPYIVADLDHSFHEEQTLVLKNADVVLVILRLEVACVRNAGRTLDSLDRIGVSADRIRLVVNRFGQSKELPLASAEQALGMKVHHSIPDDPKTILRANNSGIPAVLQRPWVGVSRRMTEIATSLNGTT
jgi:pilus assembly protein CpaE